MEQRRKRREAFTLMKRQHRRLRRRVIRHPAHAHITRRTRNSDDMPLIPRHHIGQKCLDGEPVAQHIDVENLAQIRLGRVEDRVRLRDPGVVDEDGGDADVGADALCGGGHGGGVGDVAFVEADEGVWRVRLVWARMERERRVREEEGKKRERGNDMENDMGN